MLGTLSSITTRKSLSTSVLRARCLLLLRPQAKRFVVSGPSAPVKNGKDDSLVKKLMKKYGYTALIVYVAVSLGTVSLSFAAVHAYGEERMSVLLNRLKQKFGYGEASDDAVIARIRRKRELIEEQKRNGEHTLFDQLRHFPLLTEFLLAYGMYKALIFVRIPLVAGITPVMFKLFKRWGFNRLIGLPKADIPKPTANGEFLRQNHAKSRKWFNGMM